MQTADKACGKIYIAGIICTGMSSKPGFLDGEKDMPMNHTIIREEDLMPSKKRKYALDKIESIAKEAAVVAYTVLALDCDYSVSLIDDPTIIEDGLFDTKDNIIMLNLARLEPFPPGTLIIEMEDPDQDENFRLVMKICYIIFHEMRHRYQKRAVEIYTLNKMLGGKMFKPLESDKKCELWLKEMQETGETTDIEEDCDDFAYYLTSRYPIELPMTRTNRRLGAMKRKYDKMEIPDS